MRIPALVLVLTLAAPCQSAEPAGLKISPLFMAHHGSTTSVAIWYPSGGGGEVSIYGSNPVFRGVEAVNGAEIAPGPHPVVMFSHGMGGSDRAQAWLASGLAGRGAIVVAVNHPNSTWGDFDMAKGADHWTRVADLSVALDMLMDDPQFAAHIDPSRIMAAGFSYGGWTALSMGGATGNLAGFTEACQTHRDRMEACDLFLSDEVSIQTRNTDAWNADYSDARITHVAAIDPGLVWGLEAADTEALVPRTILVGLGGEQDRMLATNFDLSGLAGHLPEARIMQLDPAYHFSAMPLCTDMAEAILQEEQDDPVCTDPKGTDRAAVHAAIIDALSDMLGL